MVKAKLIIDEKEINVLWFTFGFNQGADPSGRPSQRPVFTGLKLTIETRKDLNLAEWSFSSNQTKQIELHIYPVVMGGKTRKLYFYDCHLVNWDNNFNAIGNDPMTETLEITCAGVEDTNSAGIYSAYWRETFPKQKVQTTKLDQREPIFLGYHFYNENGEEIEQSKIKINDRVTLIILSENAEGETITINLNDNKLDYKYDGNILKDDILRKIQITGEKTKLELTAIKQQN